LKVLDRTYLCFVYVLKPSPYNKTVLRGKIFANTVAKILAKAFATLPLLQKMLYGGVFRKREMKR